jgi:hypothetical protein
MKNLWWGTTDKDDLIIREMQAYAREKNKQRWWWWCGGRRDKCEISINKRSKDYTKDEVMVVTVASHTEIKEWLHYYALCAIAAHHGAQLLLSL